MYDVEDYMSMLVHLSKIDNYVAKAESELLHYIGKQNGLTGDQVETIIDNPKPLRSFRTLPMDDRYQYLFDVIQVMKVDGKVFGSEINFAEKMALKLGFKPGVVADLSAYIYSDPSINTDRDRLISIAKGFIIDDDED
jgi:hypothetical protein